jgi:PAS domain S-box-containing protein
MADMAGRPPPPAPRRGALLSWIRGSARDQDASRANDGRDFAIGDEEERDAPSPLDTLPHGDLLATLEGELGHLRKENRRLRADLETRTIAYDTARESEERYRAAFHNAPIALVETDVVGTVTRCNRNAADLIGCSETDLTGKPMWQLAGTQTAPREAARHPDHAQPRRRGNRVQARAARLATQRRGDDRGRAVPRGEDRRPRTIDRVAARHFDIAERARREAEAQASANAYRDLFDGAPVMLLAVDAKNTTILECKAAVTEATGYTRAELLDRSIFDLYDPACLDQAAESFRAFLHEGESRDVKLRVRTKSGTTFSVLETSNAVADETGAILACRIAWRPIDLHARRSLRDTSARRAS